MGKNQFQGDRITQGAHFISDGNSELGGGVEYKGASHERGDMDMEAMSGEERVQGYQNVCSYFFYL